MGPTIHVVAANVGVATPLPQDGVIAITFDRYLNPGSVNRQGVALRDEFGNAPDSPLVDYDPVTRVVRLSNPNPGQVWLQVGQPYQVIFPIATSEAGSFGLRAIDGAGIDPAQAPLGFMIAPPTGTPPQNPKIDFCADVFPLFAAVRASAPQSRGLCSNSTCHGLGAGSTPFGSATGLVLETEDGIRNTAIGVQASETSTGASQSSASPLPIFPSGMPIIDPGNPGDSFLIYKLLLASTGATGSPLAYTLDSTCTQSSITAPFDYGPSGAFASTDETNRLAAHVFGVRMPWGDLQTDGTFHFPGTALALDDIERVRLWITQGAEIDDCSTCQGSLP